MNIFLTGATGYIGSHLARQFISEGHAVLGLARSESATAQLAKEGIQPVTGNLEDPGSWIEAARSSDAVIHLGFVHDFNDWDRACAIDLRVVRAMADALEGSYKPLIITSDTGVLGDTGTRVADETTPVARDFALAVRARAEDVVISSASRGVRGTVLRLPIFIYGPDNTGFLATMAAAAKQDGKVYVVNDGEQKLAALHIDDAVGLFCAALARSSAGSVYHGAGDEGVSLIEVAQALGQRMGCPVVRIPFERAASVWGSAVANFLAINNQVSATKAMAELGWEPTHRNAFLHWINTESPALSTTVDPLTCPISIVPV